MGEPKRQRRKYSRPISLWKGNRLDEDRDLVRKYGLSNNKELWKAKSEIARIRGLARNLLARPDELTTKHLLEKLQNLSLLDKGDKLEDVLKVTVEDLLERRLQTQVYRKGLSNSIQQSRQFITHGHIVVSGGSMNVPGHILTIDEEKGLAFHAGSSLSDPEHPVRATKKKIPEPEEKKQETQGVKKAEAPKKPKIEKSGKVSEEQPELTGEELVEEAKVAEKSESPEGADEEKPKEAAGADETTEESKSQ